MSDDKRLTDMELTDRQRELLTIFFDAWDRKTPDERQVIIRDTLKRIRESYGLVDDQETP